MESNYKIIVVGDAGCGKTTYINRLSSGEFNRKYIPTQGVNVTILSINTNYGLITFKVWDCAGQEKFKGLGDGYYVNAAGVIFMFDLTNTLTFKNLPQWILNVGRVNPNIPVVVCGNKCDIKDRKVHPNTIREMLPPQSKYYDISARSCHNFEKAFLSLAKQITGHEDLEFIENEALVPPEATIPGSDL